MGDARGPGTGDKAQGMLRVGSLPKNWDLPQRADHQNKRNEKLTQYIPEKKGTELAYLDLGTVSRGGKKNNLPLEVINRNQISGRF